MPKFTLTMCCSLGILLAVFVLPSQADVYAYTDKNGVKHISDRKMDSRYKLVMRTPKYKNSTRQKKPPRAVGTLESDSSGWKLITPSNKSYTNYIVPSGVSSVKLSERHSQNRQRYTRTIAQIAAQYGLDPHLIHAVISTESAFNPRAVSSAGAMGLMQLMPGTADRFGVKNAFDPTANIRAGSRYLRWLLEKFNNNLNLALAGYNAGENTVIRYGYKIPPYKETQNYVVKVREYYEYYRGQQIN